MLKTLITFSILLFFSISLNAQKKEKHFYARIWDLDSKHFDGPITNLNDSTITTFSNHKIMIWNYSKIKTIKIYRTKKFPVLYIPIFFGFGKIFSSLYEDSFKDGVKSAGTGAGIIVLFAILEEVFRKPYDKVKFPTDMNIKNHLEKYQESLFKLDTVRVK